MQNELKRYYRSIRSWLPGGRGLKNQILCQIIEAVDCYLEQNPDAGFPQVKAHFGSPQQIAASYVDALDTQELLNKLRIRRQIITAVTACTLVVLTLWAGLITWAVIKANDSFDGQFGSNVTQDHSMHTSRDYNLEDLL